MGEKVFFVLRFCTKYRTGSGSNPEIQSERPETVTFKDSIRKNTMLIRMDNGQTYIAK